MLVNVSKLVFEVVEMGASRLQTFEDPHADVLHAAVGLGLVKQQ